MTNAVKVENHSVGHGFPFKMSWLYSSHSTSWSIASASTLTNHPIASSANIASRIRAATVSIAVTCLDRLE